jgi:uncharacterized delta-60 repeat protein
MKSLSILQTFIFICLPCLLLANAGDLDPTFDGDGKVITHVSASIDMIEDIVIQPDGKIVVAGVSSGDFAVGRYNSDGSLDSTFGSGGIVTTDFNGPSDHAYDVALQPDGKIVVAGWAANVSLTDFGVVRYNTDGSLDSSFGAGGKVTTDFQNDNDSAYAVAIQSDGKIVVAGDVAIGGLFYFGIVRYNSNGALDSSFGVGGKLHHFPFGYAQDVGIQADGKIISAGRVTTSGDEEFALARYNPDGSFDTTFNGTGEVVTDFNGLPDECEAIGIQSDGKIVAVGRARTGGPDDFGIARYNSNGTLDTTFGTSGTVTTDFFGAGDGAYSVAIDADGKIVVAGYAENFGPLDTAVVRYNSDGSIDTEFGNSGKAIFDYAASNDWANGVSLQSDRKIVVAGISNDPDQSFALARLDGSSGSPACLFCDDFEDGVIAANWTYIKPAWNESLGFLTGIPAGGKAEAIAAPVFSGCTVCTVQTSMRTQGGAGNKMWLFAWYQDKQNSIELLMKEQNDKWVMKQKAGGVVVAKAKGSSTILPNTFYLVKLEFDGTNFKLSVDGTLLATMPAGATPNGTIGFRVKNTTGDYAFIQVN